MRKFEDKTHYAARLTSWRTTRVSHKTKWSLKSRVVYVAKILWCWRKAEIITLKVSTEEEEEVQLKLSEDFFRFWGVVIIVMPCSGREQTLSGWVKGAGEPWHRWNLLDVLVIWTLHIIKVWRSHDLFPPYFFQRIYRSQPISNLKALTYPQFVCVAGEGKGGGGCFLPEKPLSRDPDKFLTRFHQMNMEGARNISRTVIVKQWVGDPGDFLLSSGLWLPKLGYTQALIGQSCKKHLICPGLFEHIQVGWGHPKCLGVRWG